MKNIYQKPETTVIKIHTAQMMASSPAAPDMYGEKATGEAMSRQGGSLWDDCDDEDDADDYDEQEETFGYTGF